MTVPEQETPDWLIAGGRRQGKQEMMRQWIKDHSDAVVITSAIAAPEVDPDEGVE